MMALIASADDLSHQDQTISYHYSVSVHQLIKTSLKLQYSSHVVHITSAIAEIKICHTFYDHYFYQLISKDMIQNALADEFEPVIVSFIFLKSYISS